MTVNVKGVKVTRQDEVSISQANGCPQLPGTILRINIPAGAVINLLGLIEITSPSGICLIIRLPILGGGGLDTILGAVQAAGGTVEFVNE